jgi:hypothetical protein
MIGGPAQGHSGDEAMSFARLGYPSAQNRLPRGPAKRRSLAILTGEEDIGRTTQVNENHIPDWHRCVAFFGMAVARWRVLTAELRKAASSKHFGKRTPISEYVDDFVVAGVLAFNKAIQRSAIQSQVIDWQVLENRQLALFCQGGLGYK